MRYNWQYPDWPNFSYDPAETADAVRRFDLQLARVLAVLRSFDSATEEGKRLEAMVAEAVNTSAIEGERLNPRDVMSSMKNRLGQNNKPVAVRDYRASGVAAMMLKVREEFEEPLTGAMLFDWHRCLFEGYPNCEAPEITGGYRRDRIFIKNADIESDDVRFEGPPAAEVPRHMAGLVEWFNEANQSGMPVVLRAALAHLHFESIHPFCDGNGRVGRALISKVIAQDAGAFVMIPFSVGIFERRARYYEALHAASFSLEATRWILDFAALLTESINDYEAELQFQIRVVFLLSDAKRQLNRRQEKVFARMAREGSRGFVGGMSASKYQKIAATSKATATRDLGEMVELGLLRKTGRGPGVRYWIAE
jgi:Fic family protein